MAARPQALLVCWLAWRSLFAARGELALRAVVSVVAVLVAVIGCSLQPTALARSERIAAALPGLAPREAQTQGVLVEQTHSYFRDQQVDVRTYAVVGGPDPEQLRGLPGLGELVLSPAMATLLEREPELAARYPGRVVGTVDKSHRLGPSSLVVWRGVSPAELPEAGWLATSGGKRTDDIAQSLPAEVGYALPMLVVGFLFPLIMLMVLVGTLGAGRRERRLAAMRLVGLDDRQAKLASALEGGLVAVLALVVGGGLFLGLTPVVAPHLPALGGVWPDDVRSGPVATAVVLGAFPVLCVLGNWLGLRALSTSPLGVERRTQSRRPGRWRLAPLGLGVILLVAIPAGLRPDPRATPWLIVAGGVLVMVGLVLSLGLAVKAVADAAAARTASLTRLIAARTVAANPVRSTRVAVGLASLVCVSGPLLVYFPLISDGAALERLGQEVGNDTLVLTRGEVTGAAADVESRTDALAALRSDPDFGSTLTVFTIPLARNLEAPDGPVALVADCDEVVRYLEVTVGECEQGIGLGAGVLAGSFQAYAERTAANGQVRNVSLGPSVHLDQQLSRSRDLEVLLEGLSSSASVLLPLDLFGGVPVETSAVTMLARPVSAAAGERARTDLESALSGEALTVGERHAIATYATRQFQAIAAVAGLLAVLVAGLATLLTAFELVLAAVGERRLLAVSGARESTFRKAIWTSTMAPVLLGVVPAIAISLLTARAFVELAEPRIVPLPYPGILLVALLGVLSAALATAVLSRLSRLDTLVPQGE